MGSPVSIVQNRDCIEAMREFPDKFFDLAVVDPPYGRNAMDGSLTREKYEINRGENWDCYRPNKLYFAELQRVSNHQIIWGGNYFISDLKDTKCFIIWDKKIAFGLNNYAMCEMAWTSFDNRPAKIYSKTAAQKNRFHPTQKPIALYEWLLKNYAKPGDKILDTHLGSGSSRIAAYKMGFDFWGYEIDKDYFEQSEKRFKEAVAMPLFDAIPHISQSQLF
jgi:site-specific DNA-methyltransferase (adenine-specific)